MRLYIRKTGISPMNKGKVDVSAYKEDHRRPKLKIRDIRRERDSWVSACKVVLCYNGLNFKGLYGKTTDLF